MSTPCILSAQIDFELSLPTKPDGAVGMPLAVINKARGDIQGYNYLSVFVGDPRDIDRPLAVQGKYEFEDNLLEFTPSFPFEKGLKYVVRYKSSYNEIHFSYQSFQLGEKQSTEKVKVTTIHPLADELPENLLRFYIYFNTPMKKGHSLNHIQLCDSEGKVDSRAFMEFKYELWSSDLKRLTLLFDPGRIKRGVSTNLELGPALQEGKTYELQISGNWQDVYGNQLTQDFTKRLRVVKAYRQHMKISDWKIQEPDLDSFDTLNVYCERVMDHALVQSMIQIQDNQENLIVGQWYISDSGRVLHFTPDNRWEKGGYRIVFDNEIEDVAGNNLNSLLDQSKSTSDEMRLQSHFIHFEL